MSAYLYDEAIINNLREVVGDSRIMITPVDNVYNVIPRINDDKFTLPLVTVTRTGWTILSDDVNHSAKYEGALSQISCEPKNHGLTVQRVQFVPMRLSYAIDVWTKTRLENDEFVRELFWYYMISPTLQINVPYDLNFDHNFNLFIEPDIEDNSDIAQQVNHGEFFRQTLRIYTDDAKLWKSSSRGPTIVDILFKPDMQGIYEASRDDTQTSTETE